MKCCDLEYGSGTDTPGFESWLYHTRPPDQGQTCQPLILNLLFCKRRVTKIVVSQDYCAYST